MVDYHAASTLRLGSFCSTRRLESQEVSSYGWLIHYSMTIFDSSGSAPMYDNTGRRHAGVFQLNHQIQ